MIDPITLTGFLLQPWLFVAAFAVLIVGGGRAVRLVTQDAFPPTRWAREQWVVLTRGSDWGKIFWCHWCLAPYVVGVGVFWLIAGLLWVPWLAVAWWIVFGWAAASYLTSILVHFDEGKPTP